MVKISILNSTLCIAVFDTTFSDLSATFFPSSPSGWLVRGEFLHCFVKQNDLFSNSYNQFDGRN